MKKLFKFLIISSLFLLVLVLVSFFYIYSLFQPVSSEIVTSSRFVIPKGQAVSIIAERLEEENFIKNDLVFRLLVKQQDLVDKIQAGSFEISPSMTVREIAAELTKGTNDLWVTIPEGWRREEIAESLAAQDLLEYDQEEFLRLTDDQEGMLFPDTYLVPKMMTTESIASLFYNTFEKKVINGLEDEFEQSNQSFNEILVMASILEREAKGYEQMRHVAGILSNRLEIGMALQVDASLQYAKGYDTAQKSWWVPPTAADKAKDSLFNTYKNSGLPPYPICNPGLDAIKAVLNPLDTNDLFYIHDRNGKIHFAQTLEEHNQNVNQYLR